MYLEAVTVCVNYADDMKHVIKNRHLFDRWIVITVENDVDTVELCKSHNIEYFFSKRVFANGAPFAKSAAINEGFSFCDKKGWLLAIDGDIIPPYNFRSIVDNIPESNETKKYIFCPKIRRMVNTIPDEEKNYFCTRKLENINEMYKMYYSLFSKEISENKVITPDQCDNFVSRLLEFGVLEYIIPDVVDQWKYYKSGNWDMLPVNFEGHQQHHIGYFQLFHSESFHGYPEYAIDSHWDDIIFRNSFAKENRKVLDFECIHVGMNSFASNRLKNNGNMYPKPSNITNKMIEADDLFDYMKKDSYFQISQYIEGKNNFIVREELLAS